MQSAHSSLAVLFRPSDKAITDPHQVNLQVIAASARWGVQDYCSPYPERTAATSAVGCMAIGSGRVQRGKIGTHTQLGGGGNFRKENNALPAQDLPD